LRSARSLNQTIGRTARHEKGRVIMYGDKVTKSMKIAIEETDRRRVKQRAHNEANGITPQTVKTQIKDLRKIAGFRSDLAVGAEPGDIELDGTAYTKSEVPKLLKALKKKMLAAAQDLDFEKAAGFRDQLKGVEDAQLGLGSPAISSGAKGAKKKGAKRGRARGSRP
jgi:excinuclease ABC subunit B